MITRAHLIDVLFVIVPHSLLLEIAGPAEAFRLANQHRERRGQPLHVVAGPAHNGPPTWPATELERPVVVEELSQEYSRKRPDLRRVG